ncbi:MAG: diguanylate cyclase [Proteobacteria bacterium]|jgi:diguanylate cyclase (GGDEF)-like protein|nr:diguanylate cyclase [Desulfocapsa sp.]MBU3944132.1 diguanylate cyclase [Pseudomonadota bacterium]MCG2743940.1 diguanylate cyclase [Desulfobacteraceae bacterium]MBU4029727.1 diguanylate cyclase [Pseudomonadota bacterium]MBU4043376.1 diguanylate cyclase [Pseudomonadota bacterium]
MLNIGKQELQATLQQLDQAIYNHEQWSKDLARSIICRLPYDNRDIADDAHHQCRFGQWYYGNRPQALRDHPAFVAIETEHRHMHQLGARLLLAAANEALGSPRDYDSFTNAADRLHLEVYSLKQELEELLNNRDALTGAENRTSMLTRLRELRELVKRGIQECSIVIMDLDHFKTVNDTYGHPAGDQVLVAWVSYIKQHLRPYDRVYRYGGEEFLLSFPSTNLQTVQDIIERIRKGLSAVAIGADETKTIMVTASFGITMLEPSVSVEESINRADSALYAAKKAGRNRGCIWDPTMAPIQDGGDAHQDAIAGEIGEKN